MYMCRSSVLFPVISTVLVSHAASSVIVVLSHSVVHPCCVWCEKEEEFLWIFAKDREWYMLMITGYHKLWKLFWESLFCKQQWRGEIA